jgi:integrase
LDSVAKLTQERVAQANGRLKSANVGLSILIRNQRLYLRGTLPPKPGCLRTSAHQQEISLGYLGIRANPAGVSAAEREARRLGVALQERSFDWREHLKPQAIQKLGLELWDKYTAYKEKTVARTTLLSTYAKTRVKLVKWGEPIATKLDAYRFRDWLLETGCQPVTARKYLVNLNACFQWAVNCGLAEHNPFEGSTQGLKVSPLATPEPFSQAEVGEILRAFQQDRHYSYYFPYVRFLFLTGARPEEAVALRWQHINWETDEIHFCEAVNTALMIRKGTKTGKSRLFPMGSELRELLREQWTANVDPMQPVFVSKEGRQLNHANFTRRAWHGYTNRHGKWIPGIVTRLAEAGAIKSYREPYAMRDTFISHCVVECGLHPVQVAAWVGNSPDVIFKHYAGVVKRVEVPHLGF